MKAAVEAASAFPNLKVSALMVITSLSDAELPEIGLAPSVPLQVQRLLSLAVRAGCHGVVASVHEAITIRALAPEGFLIVTPGIHFSSQPAQDQARHATPQKASLSGASHIMVGRAISKTASPSEAFQSALTAFAQRP